MPTPSTPPRVRFRSKTMTSASISGARKSALRSTSSSEKVPPIKQAHTKQAQKEKKHKKDKKDKKERIVKKSLSQELEEEAAKAETKKEEVNRKRKKAKVEKERKSKDSKEKKPDVKTGDKEKKPDVKTGDKEKKPDVKTEDKEKKPDVKTGDKEKKPDVKTGDKEKKPDVKTGDKEKKPDVKTGDKEKKPDLKKEEKEKKDHGKKKRKKEEPKIIFSPAKKNQIEHIFQQPQDTKTPDPAGAPSTPSPTTPMSAKERAERHFEALSKCLAKSDSDDSDCHPETDLEEFVKGMEEPSDEGEDSETSDSEKESSGTSTDEDEEETAKDEKPKNVEEGSSEEEEQEDLECEASEEESQEEDEVVEPDKSTKQLDQSTKSSPNEHALVPVTAETTNQAVALRNSMTNKKEWDSFVRQAKSKMPIGLNEMYTSNKQELFSIWLDQNRDWNACTLEVARRQESQNVSKRGWKAVQGKELKAKYSEEKWQKVLQARKAAGLYYEDEDFPGDDDDPRLIKSVSLFHFVWTPQTCTTWENP